MTAESTEVCDQQTAECTDPQLSGSMAAAAAIDRRPLPARKLVDGYAQFAQTCRPPPAASQMRAAPDPRILTGWSGASPHVLRFPPRAFLRSPVCPPGSPPSPAFRWFPFVRRSPVRPLRPLPRFRCPFGIPPASLPLSNLHDSAAGRRFRRRKSRAARTKVTTPAATPPRPDLAVTRPAPQTGNGWARRDAATESPVTSGNGTLPGPGDRTHRTPLVLAPAWSVQRSESRGEVAQLPGLGHDVHAG
jgi:hypothetical protein